MNNLSNSRRKFIATTAKNSLAIGIGISSISSFLAACGSSKKATASAFNTSYDQLPLPYGYSALENAIDTATMEIHYSKHAAAYSANAKEAAQAEGIDTKQPIEAVLEKISKYSSKMRNNAGGHYNHEMFWKCMRPKTTDNKPAGKLLQNIEAVFGSFAAFKLKFAAAGATRFGSGWAWLYADNNKKLQIGSTPNQDNPLMDVSEIKGFPLLCLDVWEHAYYLKYQNKRADYIDSWWGIVNWDYVQQRLANIIL
ncbi:MAG: superoxide dismutase [Chitinophagaceae bacterium]|nr:superoxide dismutase [Chitinophagaceae bacterium]